MFRAAPHLVIELVMSLPLANIINLYRIHPAIKNAMHDQRRMWRMLLERDYISQGISLLHIQTHMEAAEARG